MAGKINYSQREKEAIASIKLNDVMALNIKRINASKNAPDLKNYSIEVRQMLPSGNTGFNELAYFNPNDPSFSQGGGVRVSWLTIKAPMAIQEFGVDSNELENLPLDGGQTRIFIGKLNPTFTVNGETKVLQLQKVAKLLTKENFDPIKDKFYYDNWKTKAKRAGGGVDARYIKGKHINVETGEITAQYIIEECSVKSATVVGDDLVNDGWDHVEIAEYVEQTVATPAAQTVTADLMNQPL